MVFWIWIKYDSIVLPVCFHFQEWVRTTERVRRHSMSKLWLFRLSSGPRQHRRCDFADAKRERRKSCMKDCFWNNVSKNDWEITELHLREWRKILPIRVVSGWQLEEDGELKGIHDDDLLVKSATIKFDNVRVWRSGIFDKRTFELLQSKRFCFWRSSLSTQITKYSISHSSLKL